MGTAQYTRNVKIYNRFKNGERIADIAQEFDLSKNRVREIINKVETAYFKEDDELYQLLMRAGRSLGASSNVIDMTYKRLSRYGIRTREDLILMDLQEYQKQWFTGDVQMRIIETAMRI